jgi:TMEM175 potassium channel family protein
VSQGTLDSRERHRDFERLLTFVDAIVAIAITLLVLPLVDLAPEVSDGGSVRHLFDEHSEELWSFGLSFYVIARFWLNQHHAVSPLLKGNARVTSLLICWTFTIVVLPFPTSLVAAAGGQATTKVLYVGTMAVSVLLLAALRVEVRRHPELTDGSPYPGPALGLATAGLLVVALLLMLAVPDLSYFPLLVLLLDGPLARVLGHSRNRSTT